MRIIYLANRWPNPNETAAGTRTLQLLRLLQANNYQVSIASFFPADTFSQQLQQMGFKCLSLKLNDPNLAEQFRSKDYQMAFFDTFLMEEKLGWVIRDALQDCMCVLDSQDLHFLRYGRSLIPSFSLPTKHLNFNNRETYRELASIYRCDLTLVISYAEKKLLLEKFHIEESAMFYLPFLHDDVHPVLKKDFTARKGLLVLGNFQHKPNLDQAKYVIQKLHKQIQKHLSECPINIVGAYPPQEITDLVKKGKNIELLGYQENLSPYFAECKLMIAPLRFGAGLKGKLMDAMTHGLPFVTSEVGAEGVLGLSDRYIAKCETEFIEKVIAVYQNESAWIQAQKHQHQLLATHFSKSDFEHLFIVRLSEIRNRLQEHRDTLFYQNFFRYHELESTKYFSKWIELKNRS